MDKKKLPLMALNIKHSGHQYVYFRFVPLKGLCFELNEFLKSCNINPSFLFERHRFFNIKLWRKRNIKFLFDLLKTLCCRNSRN
jgi:hypothetical protein